MGLWQILIGILLSISPFFELRGGIPVMMAAGVNIYTATILGIASNVLIIPVIFIFLDCFHQEFMRINFYNRLFERKLEKIRLKYGERVNTWPFFGLWFLVAIPIPTTGVYTAGLIAWFFKLNRKKSFYTMSLGVVCAGLLVTGIYAGLIRLFF